MINGPLWLYCESAFCCLYHLSPVMLALYHTQYRCDYGCCTSAQHNGVGEGSVLSVPIHPSVCYRKIPPSQKFSVFRTMFTIKWKWLLWSPIHVVAFMVSIFHLFQLCDMYFGEMFFCLFTFLNCLNRSPVQHLPSVRSASATWNSLPKTFTDSNSLGTFKSRLDRHYCFLEYTTDTHYLPPAPLKLRAISAIKIYYYYY